MSTEWLSVFARNYAPAGESSTSGTSGTSGGDDSGPSPSPAVCTTNTAYQPQWHNSTPWGSSNGASSMDAYMDTNFNVVSTINNWNDVVGNGAMAWISIGQSSNRATSEPILGEDYYIRMYRYDGDGNSQNNPSVAGGSPGPNQLYLEELNSSGVKTGNTITFQCIENASATPMTFGTQFLFKARITAKSGFGSVVLSTNNNSWYTTNTTNNGIVDFCVTWSSVTPLTTCAAITNLTVENEHTTDFVYPSSVSSSPGGGGGGGGFGGGGGGAFGG
jgi:hypothetical protein